MTAEENRVAAVGFGEEQDDAEKVSFPQGYLNNAKP